MDSIQLFEKLAAYDDESNRQLIIRLEEYEDLISPYITRQFSHILNVHHIWISRLLNRNPESSDWDLLPFSSWEKFAALNHLQTKEFLRFHSIQEICHYTSSEGIKNSKQAADILLHIFNHSTHHRAQIIREMSEKGIPPSTINLIEFN